MRQQNLQEARMQYKDQTEIARDQAFSDIRRAYSNVAIAPRFGPGIPAPVKRGMPNRYGLYSGLLGAVTSGVSTTAGLSPGGDISKLFG